MNKKRLHEELSAYLDGEASDPDHIEQLIRNDAEVRRVFEAMRHTSAQVKQLRPPQVDPAFLTRVTTRVMAGVREAEAPGRGWLHRALVPAGVALTVVMVASLFVYSRGALAPTSGPVDEWSQMDPGALMAALETRLAESPEAMGSSVDIVPVLSATPFGAEPPAEPGALRDAALDWFSEMSVDYDTRVDLDTLLGTLTEEEEDALRVMLVDYAERGWTT